MALENLYEAIALDGYFDPTTPPGVMGDSSATAGREHAVSFRVEMTAAATQASTYLIARVPSNARILPGSTVFWDDLASTGSPTLDIGLFAINSNITDDDDAINDGMDAATVNTSGLAIMKTSVDMAGKKFYELVSGQTSDPGGMLDVKITLKDADCNTGGTIAGVLKYATK